MFCKIDCYRSLYSVWPQKSTALPEKNDSSACWPQHFISDIMWAAIKDDFVTISPFSNKIEDKVGGNKIQQLFGRVHKKHNRTIIALSAEERKAEAEGFE